MNIESRSDFELVKLYKQGRVQKRIMGHFWIKYQSLIKSVVSKYYKSGKQTDHDFEDYMQNCFFCFPQVMDKLKINKIKNPELFSFGQCVKLYLEGYTKKDFRRACKNYFVTTPTSTMTYTSNDGDEYSYIDKFMVSKDNVEETALNNYFYHNEFKIMFEQFYQSCDPSLQKLLGMSIEYNTSSTKIDRNRFIQKASFLKKGFNAEYAKKKGITNMFYYKKIDELKRKFVTFFRQYGYYSDSSLKAVGLSKIMENKFSLK